MDPYYEQLIGYTIVAFEEVEDSYDGYPWPKFTLKKGDEVLTFEVSQDPEGNGPGFLFIGPPDGEEAA